MFHEHPLTCQPLETGWGKGGVPFCPRIWVLWERVKGRVAAPCIGGVFCRQWAVLSNVHEWGGVVSGRGPEPLGMPFAEEEKSGKGAFGGRGRE